MLAAHRLSSVRAGQSAEVIVQPAPHAAGGWIGTPERPLVNPVTGERLVFWKRAADTGGQLLEFTIHMAPGGFIATPHVHPHAEERFEVAGAPVMVRAGRDERLYQPGEVAVVPAGVAHSWWNPSQEEAAALIRLSPALNAETMFETFFGLAADGKTNKQGLPGFLHLMVLARAYRHESQAAPPLGWIAAPLSFALAPVGRMLGYRARYDRYSGPLPEGESSAEVAAAPEPSQFTPGDH
jgi:quercetin dioxygenase-like cupin family protein